MRRPTVFAVGQLVGDKKNLEILEIISTKTHVRLRCNCKCCGRDKIIGSSTLPGRNSCRCQKINLDSWKFREPKTKPWQLPLGEAAKRDVELGYRQSAFRRKIEYTLIRDEFSQLVTSPCFYCGQLRQLTKRGQGKTSGNFQYTGIDRIDSSLGYTPENAVPCCWSCNNAKRTSRGRNRLCKGTFRCFPPHKYAIRNSSRNILNLDLQR